MRRRSRLEFPPKCTIRRSNRRALSAGDGHRRSLAQCALGVALFAAAIVLAGCDSGGRIGTRTAAAGSATQRPATQEECRAMIDNALVAVHPERLGISADATGVSMLLNQWRTECGGAASPPAELLSLFERLFSESERNDLLSERYAPQDAGQLRDGILFRQIAQHVTRSARADVERAVELFGWVTRNVRLLSPDAPLPATTPFNAVLFGEGRAEDRAWVFAELLRQVDLDAAIVRLPAETYGDGAWLIGVPIEGKLYLFDPLQGMPVPAADDPAPQSPFVTRPATFDEIVATPALLDASRPRREGAEGALPAGTKIEMIGTPSLWSQRMEALQSALTGERFVVIHQTLAGSVEAPGLPARLAAVAGAGWKAEEIAVWPWGMRRWVESGRPELLSDDARSELELRTRHLSAPYGVISGHGDFDNFVFGWKHGHRATRLAQLAGDYRKAQSDFLKLRIFRTSFPVNINQGHGTPELRAAHDGAAEDAYLWIGTCLLEEARQAPHEQSEQLSQAIGNFRGYLADERATRWLNHARLLFADALVLQGDHSGAIAALEVIPADAPQRGEADARIRRWRSLSAETPMR